MSLSRRSIGNRNNELTNEQLDRSRILAEQIKQLRTQRNITLWNKHYVGKLDRNGKSLSDFFDKLMLVGDCIIVQTYKEDLIKEMQINNDGSFQITHTSLQQIDNRERITDSANYVDTPLPIINKGVIVAISPGMINKFITLKESFDNKGIKSNIIIPKAGDIVYLSDFRLKDFRYYINKLERVEDYVKSQTDVNLTNFDWLFKIEDYQIEGIVPQELANELADNKYKYEDFILQWSDDKLNALMEINKGK